MRLLLPAVGADRWDARDIRRVGLGDPSGAVAERGARHKTCGLTHTVQGYINPHDVIEEQSLVAPWRILHGGSKR